MRSTSGVGPFRGRERSVPGDSHAPSVCDDGAASTRAPSVVWSRPLAASSRATHSGSSSSTWSSRSAAPSGTSRAAHVGHHGAMRRASGSSTSRGVPASHAAAAKSSRRTRAACSSSFAIQPSTSASPVRRRGSASGSAARRVRPRRPNAACVWRASRSAHPERSTASIVTGPGHASAKATPAAPVPQPRSWMRRIPARAVSEILAAARSAIMKWSGA